MSSISFFIPEYNRTSPESSLFCPAWVQSVSLIPRTVNLYHLVCAAIWLVLPIFHTVRASHVPMLIVGLVVRRDVSLVTSKESQLLSWGVIILLNEDPWTPKAKFKLLFLVSVSLARFFFYRMGWLITWLTLLFYPGLREAVTKLNLNNCIN